MADAFAVWTIFHSNHWSTKGCGMCCPACGKVHRKDSLLLIGKSSLCGDSGFPLNKYVTMTIYLTSNSWWYENQCALAASLNKTNYPFFLCKSDDVIIIWHYKIWTLLPVIRSWSNHHILTVIYWCLYILDSSDSLPTFDLAHSWRLLLRCSSGRPSFYATHSHCTHTDIASPCCVFVYYLAAC